MTLNVYMPQSWQEMTPKQAENLATMLYNCHAAVKNNEAQKKQILAATYLNICREMLRQNPFNTIRIALKEIRPKGFEPFVKFIFDKEADLQDFPKTLKIKNTTLYGPLKRLKNCSISEFSYADAVFYRWHDTQNEAYLNRLVSALYRPLDKIKYTDKRKPFNKIKVEDLSDVTAALPTSKKLLIAKAFEGSRNYICSQFPFVFPKRPNIEAEQKNKIKKKYVPFGELIALKINFDPSKLDTVEAMNVYKFLSVYELELREIKKIKKP